MIGTVGFKFTFGFFFFFSFFFSLFFFFPLFFLFFSLFPSSSLPVASRSVRRRVYNVCVCVREAMGCRKSILGSDDVCRAEKE